MDVRARVRRAVSHPSPRTRLGLFVAAAAVAAVAVASLKPAPQILAGAIALAGIAVLTAVTEYARKREQGEVLEVLDAAERARLLREFVAAREAERRALWERLHDQVLQTTAGNLLRLDAARMLLGEGRVEEAHSLMEQAARTERKIFDDIRRLMTGMHIEPSTAPSDDPLQVVVAIPQPDTAPPVSGLSDGESLRRTWPRPRRPGSVAP